MNRYLKLGFTLLAVLSLLRPPLAMATNQRVALVIGNSAYQSSPLKNPVNDAGDMVAALAACGFDVSKATNANRKAMRKAIREFGNKLDKGSVGLFYYAGHGIQVNGENYLVPVRAEVYTEAEVEDECLKVSSVLRQMEQVGNRLNIIILDACRDNPFGRSYRSNAQGLAKMDAPRGSILAYATAPGSTAADGTARNGLYTSKLLRAMRQPGLPLERVFKQVRVAVVQSSKGRQTPWESSSLMGDFYFREGGGSPPSEVPPHPSADLPPEPPGSTSGIGDYEDVARKRKAVMAKWASWQKRMESEFEKAEKLCNDSVFKPKEKADIWNRFLAAYGNDNPYSDRDEALRGRAEGAQREWEAKKGQMLAMGSRPGAVGGKSFTNSLGMKFVYIAPGAFTMGSPSNEPGRDGDEKQHRVTLTRGYFLQATEVTQGQWKAVMDSNPSSFKNCGDDCPVENVSWNDAQNFIQKLNQKEGGNKYRLPTESEWEYAARSGSEGPIYAGKFVIRGKNNAPALDDIAWYGGNSCVDYSGGKDCSGWDEKQYSCSSCGTHPVALKKPNAWGLYDMIGNVWEWCQDWKGDYPSRAVTDPTGPSGGSGRVARGGSWYCDARYCRSADRGYVGPGVGSNGLGFRLLRTN
jgi:formylglycine-generating enzyme required for sulfatase activity